MSIDVGKLEPKPSNPEWPVAEDGLEVIERMRVLYGSEYTTFEEKPSDVISYDLTGSTHCQVGFFPEEQRVSLRYGYKIGAYVFSYNKKAVFLHQVQALGVGPDYDTDVASIVVSESEGPFEKTDDGKIIDGLASYIQDVIMHVEHGVPFDPEVYKPLFDRLDSWAEVLARSVVYTPEERLLGEYTVSIAEDPVV